jgi:hypothetical protein
LTAGWLPIDRSAFHAARDHRWQRAAESSLTLRAKVTMRDAPLFDPPEHFDPSAIRLFDISGIGAADLIYLGRGAPNLP